MIKYENGKYKYFDKNGKEITEGCKVKYEDGVRSRNIYTVYLTENNELGTDATNPAWVESGRAVPCEYGIYPFCDKETEEVEVVDE